MAARPHTAQVWWRSSLAELQRELGTSGGLTDQQARQRLKRYGRNTFRKDRTRPLLLEFLSRFRNPLVLILLAASADSAATGETASFVIVLLLVLFSSRWTLCRSAPPLRFGSRSRCAPAWSAMAPSVKSMSPWLFPGTW